MTTEAPTSSGMSLPLSTASGLFPLSAETPRFQILALPFRWQRPARTEEAAYWSMRDACDAQRRSGRAGAPAQFTYLAVPWATLIDGLDRGDSSCGHLLAQLLTLCEALPPGGRVVTVGQHIRMAQHIGLLKRCGVTDVFWSHKMRQQATLDGVRLHAFPLYPAQTRDDRGGALYPDALAQDDRPYLTSFMGAYNPLLYLSNVRELIFQQAGQHSDIPIIQRAEWHFDRMVYQEQIGGKAAAAEAVLRERRNRDEYIELLAKSRFSLCPTGSGPNSIRLFESIDLGAVPIILTTDLDLPFGSDVWGRCCLMFEDSQDGLALAMAKMKSASAHDLVQKRAALAELQARLAPSRYGAIILGRLADSSPERAF